MSPPVDSCNPFSVPFMGIYFMEFSRIFGHLLTVFLLDCELLENRALISLIFWTHTLCNLHFECPPHHLHRPSLCMYRKHAELSQSHYKSKPLLNSTFQSLSQSSIVWSTVLTFTFASILNTRCCFLSKRPFFIKTSSIII